MAYEMLSGRPPFAATTAQAMLAAHVTEAPEPVTKHRTTVPAALNELILKCLEKKPADRWQKADELIPHVAAMLTPTGGTTPTATQPHPAVAGDEAVTAVDPLRVAGLFVAASLVVLLVVYLVVHFVGLPDWVFAGAIALLAVGLPIMLMTSHHERRRALARSSGRIAATPSGGLTPHFTWRKAFLGGGIAFATLGVVSAGYMAMRALGIGPVGTLVASGVLDERDAVILASFDNRTSDTTLGPTVTELFRVGLTQSPVIKLVDQTRMGAILGRMQRPASTRVDRAMALEMAEREGLRAVIVGEIVPVGTGYALTAQMLSAAGATLTAQQSAARDAGELFAAAEQLSQKIRERFGESLRTIRRTQPLHRVTTPSLAALRLYTQALAAENAGDEDRAVALLEEAIAADTAFAMAYRKLGTILGNIFEQRARAIQALTKAYEHRDRLTDREAAYAAGIYHTRVTGERERAIAAYRTLLDRYPDDGIALNNTGVPYGQLNDYRQAGEYYARAVAQDSTVALYYSNLAFAYAQQRRYDDALVMLDRLERRFPGNPRVLEGRANSAFTLRRYDSSLAYTRQLREAQRGNLLYRAETSQRFADVAIIRGRLAEAEPHFRDAQLARAQRGSRGQLLEAAINWAGVDLRLRGDRARALRQVATALQETPVEALPPLDRPYWFLVWVHGLAGDAAGARRWADAFQRSGLAETGRTLEREVDEAGAIAALIEGRRAEAIATLQRTTAADECYQCGLVVLAWAYDVAENVDSALAYWQRYADLPVHFPVLARSELPNAYRRLGELYELKGDRKALRYYGDFVDLWKDADPELQPVVSEVKQRMARLVGEGR
jgi:tetratricopeptide (TPR) repeat protein